MKILLLPRSLSNRPNLCGFLTSAFFHAMLVLLFIHIVQDIKPTAQEEMTSISLDFFNPALEESIAQTNEEQILADEPVVEEVMEEEIVEEPEPEPEPIIEDKPEPIVEKPKPIEKPKEKPKPKPKEKPKPKAQTKSLAKTTSKDSNANATNIRPSTNNQVGEFNFATSKGDDRFAKIQRAIKKYQNYPKKAAKMRQQGIVEVSFMFKTNGTVNNVKVVKSSGHDSLDEAAVQTVKRAHKDFPILDKDYLITIPLSYRLI